VFQQFNKFLTFLSTIVSFIKKRFCVVFYGFQLFNYLYYYGYNKLINICACVRARLRARMRAHTFERFSASRRPRDFSAVSG
jgi:hypothetical protein